MQEKVCDTLNKRPWTLCGKTLAISPSLHLQGPHANPNMRDSGHREEAMSCFSPSSSICELFSRMEKGHVAVTVQGCLTV